MKKVIANSEKMRRVYDSAAEFQKLVPNAVMVGGSAVSAHIGQRQSFDHDHVLADLAERFASIFDFLTEQKKWHTAHVRQGKIILGSFDGVETGFRQLRRCRPLETEELSVPGGKTLVVPTLDEILRVKAFLITNRNQTRDYIDVAALADRFGVEWGSSVLLKIDDYYEKRLLQNPCGRRGRRPSHSESRRFLANREGPRPRGLVPGEVLQEPREGFVIVWKRGGRTCPLVGRTRAERRVHDPYSRRLQGA